MFDQKKEFEKLMRREKVQRYSQEEMERISRLREKFMEFGKYHNDEVYEKDFPISEEDKKLFLTNEADNVYRSDVNHVLKEIQHSIHYASGIAEKHIDDMEIMIGIHDAICSIDDAIENTLVMVYRYGDGKNRDCE